MLTASMCHVCFKQIPATLRLQDNQIWMKSVCDKHGEVDVMVESDARFCAEALQYYGDKWTNLENGALLNITHRCNNNCPSCYNRRNRKEPDPSIAQLVGRTMAAGNPYNIALFGGEPTVREDIAEVIDALLTTGTQHVAMYTNGIKLADKDYVKYLEDAGLFSVGFSLHHPEYSTKTVYKKKLKALENLRESQIIIDHIAFSMQHEEQLPDILKTIEQYKDYAHSFRIRPVYNPDDDHPPMFMSELFKLIKNNNIYGVVPTEEDSDVQFYPGARNARHTVGILYRGIPIFLMTWPTNKAIDLSQSRYCPRTLFQDHVMTFPEALVTMDGIKKGWLMGYKIK